MYNMIPVLNNDWYWFSEEIPLNMRHIILCRYIEGYGFDIENSCVSMF